jgi:hypothetical protein
MDHRLLGNFLGTIYQYEAWVVSLKRNALEEGGSIEGLAFVPTNYVKLATPKGGEQFVIDLRGCAQPTDFPRPIFSDPAY